jgi:hypothetical protein
VTPAATLRLLPSLRPGRYVPVSAFDRFDEILYLVENASDLTLPDLGRNRLSIRCDFLSQCTLELQRNFTLWRPSSSWRESASRLPASLSSLRIAGFPAECACSYSLYIEWLVYSSSPST